MKISISFDEKPFYNLIDNLGDMDNLEVKYGILEGAGNYPESEFSIATVLAMHELQDNPNGAYPKRDPLAKSFEKLFPLFLSQMRKGVSQHLKSNGAVSLRRYLDNIGERGVSEAKGIIGNPSILEPNTYYATMWKRNPASVGKNTPLKDFGIIENTLKHKVSKGVI